MSNGRAVMMGSRLLPALLLAIFAVLSLTSAVRKSATWDETMYLGLGAYLLENRTWDVPAASLQPPLSYYLHSLPLLFCDMHRACFKRGEVRDLAAAVERGQCLMTRSSPPGDRLLLLARLPSVLLGMLLGYGVFTWASRLYGRRAGIFSLLLFCLSPNILAHSRLITADISLTTFGFLSVYLFWANARSASLLKILLCGLCLGLALLSKHAGLLWVPILAVFSVWNALAGDSKSPSRTGSPWKGSPILTLGAVVAIAFFTLFLGYGFRGSVYTDSLLIQKGIVGEGFPAFLNGNVSGKGGWWYYYLFAFFMKTPVPLLALFAGGVAMLFRSSDPGDGFSDLCLVLPAVVFFGVFSFFTRLNVGLRYILPVFPFLMVLSGRLVRFALQRRLPWKVALVVLLTWYGGECLFIHPHYLAYFNQFAGGPKNGYRHLVDSNLDWGQDLKGLRAYLDRRGMDRVILSYFGSADPSWYGISYAALPSFIRLPPPQRPYSGVRPGDILAVSATNLYPLYVDLGPLSEYLRKTNPVDQVGYSILIYEIPAPGKGAAEP
ncbi:MAG: glycosyltransferase family 39 protein [Deltaproteobacteria bacterium]|nr:glycosyltransferase family 39 protein [Deltaproteobacteria bacterium]